MAQVILDTPSVGALVTDPIKIEDGETLLISAYNNDEDFILSRPILIRQKTPGVPNTLGVITNGNRTLHVPGPITIIIVKPVLDEAFGLFTES